MSIDHWFEATCSGQEFFLINGAVLPLVSECRDKHSILNQMVSLMKLAMAMAMAMVMTKKGGEEEEGFLGRRRPVTGLAGDQKLAGTFRPPGFLPGFFFTWQCHLFLLFVVVIHSTLYISPSTAMEFSTFPMCSLSSGSPWLLIQPQPLDLRLAKKGCEFTIF